VADRQMQGIIGRNICYVFDKNKQQARSRTKARVRANVNNNEDDH
jgi:hypothetical protein